MTENQQNEGQLTRRERREAKRQLQRDQASRSARKGLFRSVVIWGFSALAVVGLGYGMVKLAGQAPSGATLGNLSRQVDSLDDIKGPASASITLIEYSDFQCPACGAFAPIVDKALAEPDLAGKVKFVYRNFPLQQHQNAQIAAQAAQAAAEQGKFWEMHDILFKNQNEWSGMSNTGARNKFADYAQQLGLDVERFKSHLDDKSAKDKISLDYNSGLESGVDATPSFFVNGIKMPQPQSYEEFKNFVLNGIPTATK